MRRYLICALLALPVPALAQWTSGLHDTGIVRFEGFDNGKLGAFFDGDDGTIGEGFVFEGENGLFEGAFLVGQDFEQVSGDVYDYPDVEWVTVAPVAAIQPPAGFDEAYEAVYDDSGAPNPIGLTVTQTTLARAGDPFVVADFLIENTSGDDLEELYVGVFADWNVGDYTQNDWWYSETARLLYALDLTGSNPNYYGVAALDLLDDAYSVTGVSGCAYGGDAILYGGLTIFSLCGPGGPKDVRAILGVGPFDITAGGVQRVLFAFVGGTSYAEILANAEAAQCLIISECPPTSSEPTVPSAGAILHAAAPNPVRGTTTLSFTLDRPLPVRLSVHDVLGREAAVLVDGVRAAGDHEVRWDATGLPAGVYVVRVEAGGGVLTRRVTLVR